MFYRLIHYDIGFKFSDYFWLHLFIMYIRTRGYRFLHATIQARSIFYQQVQAKH